MKTTKQNQPLVSIVMPVYNAAPFVRQAVESIRSQTYPDWELIIVDDASTDGSYKIIKKIANKDNRIKLFKNKTNSGIGKTMNILLSHAKGDFIARMDADDIAFPDRLEKQVNYLKKHSEIGVLGGYMIEINEHNDVMAERKVPLTHQEIYRDMMITQAIQNPSLMLRKSRLPKDQLRYDGRFSPVDDLDLFFRLLKSVQFANIPEHLMYYRKHSNNSSLKNIRRTFALTWKVRMRALFLYEYRAGLKQFLIHWIQTAIVFSLPNKILYTLFKLWKGDRVKKPTLKPRFALKMRTNM